MTPPCKFTLPTMFLSAATFPGRRTRRPYMQRGLVRQTPKPRLPNCAAAGSRPRRANLSRPQCSCLPPHSPGGVHAAPTCNGALCGKHQNHACQTAPRRGQDPALRLYGNCEQNRKYQFPSGRRGGLQAARAILSCREQAVAASTHPCSVGRGLDPAVGVYLACHVPGFLYIPRI